MRIRRRVPHSQKPRQPVAWNRSRHERLRQARPAPTPFKTVDGIEFLDRALRSQFLNIQKKPIAR